VTDILIYHELSPLFCSTHNHASAPDMGSVIVTVCTTRGMRWHWRPSADENSSKDECASFQPSQYVSGGNLYDLGQSYDFLTQCSIINLGKLSLKCFCYPKMPLLYKCHSGWVPSLPPLLLLSVVHVRNTVSEIDLSLMCCQSTQSLTNSLGTW